MMKFTFTLGISSSHIISRAVLAAEYDLVINSGRVIDPETMYDGIANVGIKDSRIAAITNEKITGAQTINAKGVVVAPGFIDTHFHATDPLGRRIGAADGNTTAKYLGDSGLKAMQERGRVQVSKVTDLTIFDPKKVAAKATYKKGENALPPTGIPYVVVAGRIVVKDSVVQNGEPGQPIRLPVENKGHFEPITVNGWMAEHTIDVPQLPHFENIENPVLERNEH